MGVLYAAYDPQLGRKVALKLLRAALGDSADSRARLLREAQAMARLSHPNVVSVYDVGTFEEKVFVAMELIDGRTLDAWLRERPRTWREILGVFREAGKGLAAAHAAELVHLDFKPGNVLVRRDEVVKVSDFGLALSQPAQLRGGPVDARADQYSFCVALYEALVGERPSEGQTLATVHSQMGLADQRARSRMVELPKGVRIPAWVLQPILRGLSPNPADRFETLEKLLAAISAEPRSKWRRALSVAAAAVVAVGIVAGYRVAVHRHSQICKGAEAKLAGVWDAPKRAAIEQAFLSTAKPFAQDAFTGVERALDGWTRQWVAMHVDACEATRLRGEQSEALLDLRMDCLRRRVDEVRALSDLFAKADAQIVEKAVEAARSIAPLRGCADVASLIAPIKLPSDPAVRAAVEQERSELARVQALRETGKYAEGLELAKVAAAASRKHGYRPLEAEALHLLGQLQEKTGDVKSAEVALAEASWAAEAGRLDEVKAKAWIDLIHVVGYRQAGFEQAHRLAQYAAATVDRLEHPPELDGRLHSELGSLSLKEGKHAEAAAHLKQALLIREKAFGPEHPETATSLTLLASLSRERGAFEEAVNYSRRSLEILEKTVGSQHPLVADALTNIGLSLRRIDKLDEALEAHRRALAIWQKAVGPESPAAAASLVSIGSVLRLQQQPDEAMASEKRALAIQEKALGPDHPDVARTLGTLGNLALDMGADAAAVQYHRRELAILEKTLGAEHPQVAYALSNLGFTLYAQGNLRAAMDAYVRALAIREKALGPEHALVATTVEDMALVFDDLKNPSKGMAYHRRALSIREKALGPEHPAVAFTLRNFARSYILAGRPREAIPLLERALAMYKGIKGSKGDTLLAQLTLARALWDSGKDRDQALALGRRAYEAIPRAKMQHVSHYRELEAWLLPKLKSHGERPTPSM